MIWMIVIFAILFALTAIFGKWAESLSKPENINARSAFREEALKYLKTAGYELTAEGLEYLVVRALVNTDSPAKVASTIIIHTMALDIKQGQYIERQSVIVAQSMILIELLTKLVEGGALSARDWTNEVSKINGVVHPSQEQDRWILKAIKSCPRGSVRLAISPLDCGRIQESLDGRGETVS